MFFISRSHLFQPRARVGSFGSLFSGSDITCYIQLIAAIPQLARTCMYSHIIQLVSNIYSYRVYYQLASQYTQIHLDAIRVNFGPFLGHPVFMGHRGHSRVNKCDPVATLICTIANGLWQPMHKHTLTRTHQWLQLYPTQAYTRYFTGQGCPMSNYIANYKYPCS